jgi:NAD(P)-dependent dehydrogenase (short-subunit alcohol dehydrogenase family)
MRMLELLLYLAIVTNFRYRGFMSGVDRAPDIPQSVVDSVFATNVTGLINMTQAILSIFKRRAGGGRGDIIMIGSIAGREPYVGGSVREHGHDHIYEVWALTYGDLLCE